MLELPGQGSDKPILSSAPDAASALNFDNKASGLLTHVSVMTGIVTVLYGNEHTNTWKWVFVAQLSFYIILTLLALSCLHAYHKSDIESDRRNLLLKHRTKVYNVAHKGAILATISLLASLLAKQAFY
jgi:uncharacterized membrane protein